MQPTDVGHDAEEWHLWKTPQQILMTPCNIIFKTFLLMYVWCICLLINYQPVVPLSYWHRFFTSHCDGFVWISTTTIGSKNFMVSSSHNSGTWLKLLYFRSTGGTKTASTRYLFNRIILYINNVKRAKLEDYNG